MSELYVNYHFDNCILVGNQPGHTFIDVGELKGFPDAKAMLISSTMNYYEPRSKVSPTELKSNFDDDLYPWVCILLYSPEQALAYADVFAAVAEDLKKLKENKED